jgi:hypothetical protein
MQQLLFSLLIMYGSSCMFWHYIAISEAFLAPSERFSIEEQSIEYCGYSFACFSIEHPSEGTRNAL